MSSMENKALGKPLASLAILATTALSFSVPVASESIERWEMARAELVAAQPKQAGIVVERWKFLTENELQSFTQKD